MKDFVNRTFTILDANNFKLDLAIDLVKKYFYDRLQQSDLQARELNIQIMTSPPTYSSYAMKSGIEAFFLNNTIQAAQSLLNDYLRKLTEKQMFFYFYFGNLNNQSKVDYEAVSRVGKSYTEVFGFEAAVWTPKVNEHWVFR
jgi:hypothetical protein